MNYWIQIICLGMKANSKSVLFYEIKKKLSSGTRCLDSLIKDSQNSKKVRKDNFVFACGSQ